MKKALIAGVASLAVAAMPVVGVFADDITSQTDTLEVTIDSVCTFKASETTRTDGDATWAGNVLSGTMMNGTNSDNYGSTKFTVVCNNADGWQVTNTTADLAGADTAEAIAPNAAHSATVSGYSWTVSQEGDVLTIPSGKQGAGGDVASMAAATEKEGVSFTITYGIGIAEDQAADTYTGDVVYTLATL